MRSPLRVLHCIPTLGAGGADRFVSTLLRYQKSEALIPRLCVLNGSAVLQKRLPRDIETDVLDFNCSPKNVRGWRAMRASLRTIRDDFRPDLVHCHLWPACRFVTPVFADPETTVLWHIHDTWSWLVSKGLRSRCYRSWTRSLLKRYRPRMVAVSHAAAEYTRTNLPVGPDHQIEVIPSAVDTNEFRPGIGERPDGFVIGLASVFRSDKGHRHLIEAARRLADRGVGFRIRLAGDGPCLGEIRAQAEQLGLADRVDFLGHVDEVGQFLRTLDAVALPSTAFEGLPMCILEAMATGLPVVATRVSGIPEAVEDGITGLLIEPGDSVALADALGRLAVDSKMRSEMGRAALESARGRFDFAMISKRFEDYYRSILKRKDSRLV